jgi:serine/threonine protein kinase
MSGSMSSERERAERLRPERLLEAALRLTAEERVAFLDRECGGDAALRAAVEELLSIHAAAGSFLEPPVLDLPMQDLPTADAAETSATVIGPYRLLELLGQGGMGEVWLAEQKYPVRRRVAIKLIKAGMDTQEVVARFESERQALALMDHPAIAKVFEAGSTAEGRPYFVMEYVAGMPITRYCDRHRFSTRQRLELFISVCEAVQHAHQKAIIHRDLKPSNILVTEVGGKAVPRIIDFGVAKATSLRLSGQTLYTQMGALIGTLEYMSPEQADSGGVDIDTRSDVYALGVVLYELLCGALPFDFGKLAYAEVLRHLREEEAPRPSHRLRTLAGDSALAAKNRNADLPTLVDQLRGDPDVITLKALEKDRGRRYATPLELAADIGRFLRNEPVLAHTPSASYRARKWLRRHRIGATLASLLVLLVVIFAIAQTVELRRIRRERDRADRITHFLTNMFKVPAPSEARGDAVTAREILDRSSNEIERGLDQDPVVRSQLMQVMAETYEDLGIYSRAHALTERVLEERRKTLGPRNAKTLEAMSQMGWILFKEGRDTEAEQLIRKTIDLQSRVVGATAPATITSKEHLARMLLRQAHYGEAEKLTRDLVADSGRELGPESPQTMRAMDALAIALAHQSRFREAEAEYRQLLDLEIRDLGADHPDTLATMRDLANTFDDQGNYDEAEKLYRETLKIQERVLGPEHPDTAHTMTTLANTIRYEDSRKPEAEGLYRKALEIELRVLGPEHPITMRAREGLANILSGEKRYGEAETLLREIVNVRQRLLGPDHTDTLLSQYNLASVLNHENKLAEAEPLMRQTLKTQARVLDKDDPDTLASEALLAKVLLEEKRLTEAEELARQAFDAQMRALGAEHRDTIESLETLGTVLLQAGRYEDARRLFLDTIDKVGRKKEGAVSSATIAHLWYDLACLAALSGRRDAAFDSLGRAFQAGYKDARSTRADDDLKSLRNDPRFERLLASVTADNTAAVAK